MPDGTPRRFRLPGYPTTKASRGGGVSAEPTLNPRCAHSCGQADVLPWIPPPPAGSRVPRRHGPPPLGLLRRLAAPALPDGRAGRWES